MLIKTSKAKQSFGDDIAHKILRLFDDLPNFPFAISETMGDYYL